MAKVRIALTVDEDVLQAVKIAAARAGKGTASGSKALRRGLGLNLLERLWSRNRMSNEDAMALAIEGQQATRTKSH
jgi:hypothetical protein